MSTPKLRVLMELRPALEGYAGIPQETRLLFRELAALDDVQLEGLILAPFRQLARGTSTGRLFRNLSPARRFNRYSRVVVSLSEKPFTSLADTILDFISRRFERLVLSLLTLLGLSRITLTRFESAQFEDFVWRTFFSKTLPTSDFPLVTRCNHRICSVGWENQHAAGLFSMHVGTTPTYPRLDTSDFDVFISQTPYPARVARRTALVVRYHDAIPVFLPHTIHNKRKHQAQHFYSLMGNVQAGAHFACVSEASRSALLAMFPQVEERAVTIHNIVSGHYFQEDSPAERVPQIIRSWLDRQSEICTPKFLTLRESETFYRRALDQLPLKYLLVVSTVEPRKNHMRLLAAWDTVRSQFDQSLKLVVVGGLGWDVDVIMRAFKSSIDRGAAFFLAGVPPSDLRVLYRHAAATVCPSLAEGFDFSGIEAMRSGGVTVASDIPVHREIYANAAEYFDPYSTTSAADALQRVLIGGGGERRRAELRANGAAISQRYLPEVLSPKWSAFLAHVTATGQ